MATTIQSEAVLDALRRLGHATNLCIHRRLAQTFPQISLTSVHRITHRLVERGEAGYAPSDGRNVVLDARADLHDHFVCSSCGTVVDIELSDGVIAEIQEQLGNHLARDGITIRGRCETCATQTPP